MEKSIKLLTVKNWPPVCAPWMYDPMPHHSARSPMFERRTPFNRVVLRHHGSVNGVRGKPMLHNRFRLDLDFVCKSNLREIQVH